MYQKEYKKEMDRIGPSAAQLDALKAKLARPQAAPRQRRKLWPRLVAAALALTLIGGVVAAQFMGPDPAPGFTVQAVTGDNVYELGDTAVALTDGRVELLPTTDALRADGYPHKYSILLHSLAFHICGENIQSVRYTLPDRAQTKNHMEAFATYAAEDDKMRSPEETVLLEAAIESGHVRLAELPAEQRPRSITLTEFSAAEESRPGLSFSAVFLNDDAADLVLRNLEAGQYADGKIDDCSILPGETITITVTFKDGHTAERTYTLSYAKDGTPVITPN